MMKATKNKIKGLVGVFVLLMFADSMAYQLKQRSLQEMFDSAVQVSRVKVASSKQVLINGEKIIYDCGLEYNIEVVSNYKGKGSALTFRSASGLMAGKEYLIFFNTEYLDAHTNYLSMGKKDTTGYETCNDKQFLYASGFHGEIFEFDGLWKVITGKESVKASVDAAYLEVLKAEKVEFESGQVSEDYLDALSYWRIPWKLFEDKLLAMSSKHE